MIFSLLSESMFLTSKFPSFFQSLISISNLSAQNLKQGVYVTRESAGNLVERAVVMTLRRAEVNEGGACLPGAGKKNAELFQRGAIH